MYGGKVTNDFMWAVVLGSCRVKEETMRPVDNEIS